MATKNLTRDELIESIQNYLQTIGKRMTNLNLAKLKKLQEIAQIYNLPVTKEKEVKQSIPENYYEDTFKIGDIAVVYNSNGDRHKMYEFYKIVGFTPKNFIRGVKLPCEDKRDFDYSYQVATFTYIPDISYKVQNDNGVVIRNKFTNLYQEKRVYEYRVDYNN